MSFDTTSGFSLFEQTRKRVRQSANPLFLPVNGEALLRTLEASHQNRLAEDVTVHGLHYCGPIGSGIQR